MYQKVKKMKIDNVQEFENRWNKSNDKQRWQLLIDNPQLNLVVSLDNDCTTVWCEENEDIYLDFHSDIGNRAGVEDLLNVLNIKNQPV